MKLIAGMAIGGLTTALLLPLLPGLGAREAWLGMAGPLVMAILGWLAVERTWKTQPEALTATQVKLFVARMVFMGAYLGVLIGIEWVDPVPFAISFTGYFLALYAAEGAGLYRLLQKPGAARMKKGTSGGCPDSNELGTELRD